MGSVERMSWGEVWSVPVGMRASGERRVTISFGKKRRGRAWRESQDAVA